MAGFIFSFSLPTFHAQKKDRKSRHSSLPLPDRVCGCLIIPVIARHSDWTRQEGRTPLLPWNHNNSIGLNLKIWFRLLAFLLLFCYFVAPRHLCGEADSRGLDRSPAAPKDLLNLIPVWRSSSVLASRFPGESRPSPLPSSSTSSHHPHSVSISFVLPRYPRATEPAHHSQ